MKMTKVSQIFFAVIGCSFILSAPCYAQRPVASEYNLFKKLAAQARSKKNNDKFVEYENALLKLCRANPQANKSREAEVYCDLGNFYYEEKKYAMAAQHLNSCLHIVKSFCTTNSVTMVKLQSTLCSSYELSGNSEKAKDYFKTNLSASEALLKMVESRTKALWKPNKRFANIKVVTYFTVNSQGDFSNIRLAEHVEPTFDATCLAALKNGNAKPMKSWPYYAPDVNVEFDFQSTGISSSRTELAVLNGMNKINSEISKQLADFIAMDTDKNTVSPAAALKVVALCENYIKSGRLDKAEDLLRDVMQRPILSSETTSVSKTMLESEIGCLLYKQQNLEDAETTLKLAVESPLFDQITPATERQRFLKAYGDVLFKQGKEAEANAIYARSAALNK